MAKEIERKFLLKDDSWKKSVSSSVYLCQAYIAADAGEKHCTVRVRIAGERAFLTLKGRSGKIGNFSRSEFEYEIPLDDARNMLKEFCGNIVEKTRYVIETPPYRWEIDEFAGENSGLVLAEIELPSEDSCFVRPPWLGEEVTLDHSYSNSFLAQHPWQSRKNNG